MKILQITPILDPSSLWAGSHRVVFDVSRTLVRRGHDVTVCTSDMINVRTRIKNLENTFNEFEIIRVKNISVYLSTKFDLLFTPELNKFFSREIQNYDLIHAHEYTTYQNIVVHKFAKKYRIPYILQAHGSLVRIGKKFRKWVYDILFGYRVLRDASKVIALSKVEAEQYKRMGVPEEKIAIIPNGIDPSEYAHLPPKGAFKRKFNIDDDEKVVLYLGRIHESKGLDLLADAFSIVCKDINNVRLVVVGPDDGYATTFSRRISDLGIREKVLLTGFVKKRDKLAALIDSDVFVTPRFYGFPMTFLEACAVGTPIITTSFGDTLEWIDGNVGYVIQPTPQSLAEAIYRIVFDYKLRREFSRNCVNMVRSKFSLEKVGAKLEEVYKEVVGK